MENINVNSFQALADAVGKLGIPTPSLAVVFGLLGVTGTVTADALYHAWTTYRQSPAYSSSDYSRKAS